ncbi:MAG: carbohydrate ABC transporter permease, partial [Bifidobacteriales bacterium]|nr:carbohydrate ABC transporter permease [Bifidobacteriales bacterium]
MTSATYTPDTATQAQSSTTVNKRSKTGTIVHAVLVVLVMLVLLGVPFWLLIVTAGKSQAEAIRPTMSLPSHWQLLQNFSTVITDGKMIKAFFGSVIVTVPSVFLALLLGSMASWVLARRATKPMT